MSAPVVTFYEKNSTPGGGVVINGGNPIVFSSAPRGVVSYATGKDRINIWNDKGGGLLSDSIAAPRIRAFLSGGGTSSPLFTGTVSNGFTSMLECRSRGAYGTVADQQETWTPISPFSALIIGQLPSNCMRELELRLNVPPDAPDLPSTGFVLQVGVA